MGRGSVAWFFTVQGGFCLGQRWMWVFLSPAASLSHFPFFQSFWPIFILRKLKVKTWNFLLRSFVFFFFLMPTLFFLSLSMTPWKAEEEKETEKLFCKACYVYERQYLSFSPDPMEYFKHNQRVRDEGALKSFLIMQQRRWADSKSPSPSTDSLLAIPYLNLTRHGEHRPYQSFIVFPTNHHMT